MTTVQIGPLVFQGTRRGSEPGLFFGLLKDWAGIPPRKDRAESRPRAHGSFRRAQQFRAAAAPTLGGFYQGGSRTDALQMRDELVGVLAEDLLTCTVVDELGATRREIAADASIGEVIGARFAFTIDMEAADPLRYGPETSSTTGPPVAGGGISWPLTWPLTWAAGGSEGRLVIDNPGTEASFSRFGVTGGATGGFSIAEVGTGREIRLERLIPATSTVVVEQRTGRVWIDDPGNDVSGFLTRADWFAVPAGGQSIVQFNILGDASGSPTLTHWTSPAYW